MAARLGRESCVALLAVAGVVAIASGCGRTKTVTER